MSFNSNRRQLNHLTNPNTSPLSQLENTNFHIHGQTLFYLFILFAIVLLATLLLLYARWFFRFRHLRTAAASIQRAPQPTHAKGLEAALIKAMPITLYLETAVERTDETHDTECCICLAVFDEGDKVKVLTQCKHTFHSHCVDLWLSSQPTCPLCRLSLLPPPTPTPTPTQL